MRRLRPAAALATLSLLLAACGGGSHNPVVATGVLPPNPGRAQMSIGIQSPPPTIAQTHVMNAVYNPATATLVANCSSQLLPYVTYAYSNNNDFKKLHDCGIKTVMYMSPSAPGSNETLYTPNDNAALSPGGRYAADQAKDCSSNPITMYNNTRPLFDPHGPTATAYLQSSLDQHINFYNSRGANNEIDAVFSDNADTAYGDSAQPCDWTGFADWSAATAGAYSGLNIHGAQIFLNSLSITTSYSVAPSDDTVANALSALAPSTVAGAELEGFIYDLFPNHAARWSVHMNSEIRAVAMGKTFWAYVDHNFATVDPTSTTGIMWRNYLYASWLLGYDPNHSIFQEASNGATLAVFPETGLVPMYPVKSAASDISELKDPSGLYVREFQGCYYRGNLVGACEVVVNSSAAAINVPATIQAKYPESMLLTGSDVADGGTFAVNGPTVTSLASYTGAILFP